MIIYIILATIIYIIFIIGLFLVSSSNLSTFIKSMNTIILKSFRFNSITHSSLSQYYQYLHSDKPLIIISNHQSLFDSFVLMSIFGHLSYVVGSDGMSLFPGVRSICNKLKFIQVDSNKKNNITQKIIDYSSSHKPNQPFVTIFPDKLNPIPDGKNICPFKTGAFVGKFDILPIVIKYKNYSIHPFYWNNKKCRGLSSLFEKFLDDKCDVYVDIMPVVSCKSQWSIEQYRDYVYNLMNDRFDHI
tara:strand:- start:92 stop:823 length:732 start_codon:yes stop_codon:yes gene_type:complete